MAVRPISIDARRRWARYLISLILWFLIATACAALLAVLDHFLVICIAMVCGINYTQLDRAISRLWR